METTSLVIRRKDFSKQSSRYNFLQRHYKKGKILDIGNIGGLYGGEGAISSPHLRFVNEATDSIVYGFDLYPPLESVDKYKNQKTGNAEEGLPYPDTFFDTVYLGELLEHLTSPGVILKEIYRILKPDGVFIIDTPNAYSANKIFKWFFQREDNLGDPTHIILFTPASLVSLLKKSNFIIVTLEEKPSGRFSKIFGKGLGTTLLVKAIKAK